MSLARGRTARWISIALLAVASACSPDAGTTDGQPDPAAQQPASSDAGESARPKPRIVLLISIDTLRADHLGLYGYSRFTSPTLDLLGMEGTVFEDASSAAPWTLPSHTTMLTGVYPLTHRVMTFKTTLDPARTTLPKMLSAHGWRTGAVVSVNWLMREKHNVTKDFEQYSYIKTDPTRRAPHTMITDRAIEWIREAEGENLFLLVHYFDVHGDYASEPEYEEMFTSPYDGPADGTSWQILMSTLDPEYIEFCRTDFQAEICSFTKKEGVNRDREEFERPEFVERDIQHLRDLYDAGIRQLDTELGRLFAYLRGENLIDETLIVVVSDHGEEFYEHGRLDHFVSTHQEVLRVPFIMRGPGIPTGLRVAAPVSLVDLAPTLLELTGTPFPEEAGFEGLSLTPLIDGGDEAPYRQRPLYGEAPGGLTYEAITPGVFPVIRSLRRDNWKLVYDSKIARYELYDLSVDPLEQNDLAEQSPAVAQRLAEEMRRRYEGFTPADLDANVELSEEDIEELRALGYVP